MGSGLTIQVNSRGPLSASEPGLQLTITRRPDSCCFTRILRPRPVRMVGVNTRDALLPNLSTRWGFSLHDRPSR